MKVKDLKARLKSAPDEMEVFIRLTCGTSYWEIAEVAEEDCDPVPGVPDKKILVLLMR